MGTKGHASRLCGEKRAGRRKRTGVQFEPLEPVRSEEYSNGRHEKKEWVIKYIIMPFVKAPSRIRFGDPALKLTRRFDRFKSSSKKRSDLLHWYNYNRTLIQQVWDPFPLCLLVLFGNQRRKSRTIVLLPAPLQITLKQVETEFGIGLIYFWRWKLRWPKDHHVLHPMIWGFILSKFWTCCQFIQRLNGRLSTSKKKWCRNQTTPHTGKKKIGCSGSLATTWQIFKMQLNEIYLPIYFSIVLRPIL